MGKVCNESSAEPPALDACEPQLEELKQAIYVDIDFDVISHALIITALHPATPLLGNATPDGGASRDIRKPKADDRLEVGVLQTEKATEPEQLSLGGYLTVVGEDDHPSMSHDSCWIHR